tara:strand:- start:10578 stop:11798 length:1221 start_codon:yes stop_codon:yes gene_type:complete
MEVLTVSDHLSRIFGQDISRRQFLKRVAIGAGGAMLASPLASMAASCGGSDAANIKVLAWGDKLNDEVNDAFKADTGHTATFTIFTENPEAMAKIKADPTAFDTVFIDGLWANGHYNAGTIVPIDFKSMSIYDDYFPQFADLAPWQLPDGKTLSIPHAWSADGIMYNKDHVDLGSSPSMASLFDPKYEGKVAIYDSFYRNFLNVAPGVTSAGIFKDMHVQASIDGGPVEEAYDLSQSYLDQTLAEMLKARKNFKMIWQDIDEITRALVSGEIWIAIGGNYITQNCLDAGATNIEFATPSAHDIMGWVDGQCVIKNEQYDKNPDAVLSWLEHYHNAESQVKIIGNTWLASTSRACLDGLEKAFPDGKERVAKLAARDTATVDKMSLLRPLANPGPFQDAWAEFLAAG